MRTFTDFNVNFMYKMKNHLTNRVIHKKPLFVSSWIFKNKPLYQKTRETQTNHVDWFFTFVKIKNRRKIFKFKN